MVVSSYGTLASVASPPAIRVAPASSVALFNTYRATYATLYRTQPEVRKSVDFIARNSAQLGLHAFRRLSDTERERLSGEALTAVLRHPNPFTSRYRLFESLFQDLGVYYNAFLLKVRGNPGLGLARLPPHEVEITGGLFPTEYVWRPAGGRELTFGPSEIIHIGGYDPTNPLAGLSPLETLRRVLAEEIAARDYREHFWRNSAHLGGVIQRPAPPAAPRWDRKQKEQFVSDWQALYSGPENAGKSPVLEDGMTWASIASNAKDAELMAARKLGREEVASAYHIPLPMVGILDHATFSNIKEQHKHLYQDCLGPLLVMTEEEFERQLVPEFYEPDDGVYLEFNIQEKLKGSFEEQVATLRVAIGKPFMTVNEGRARLNLAPSRRLEDDNIADPTYINDPGAERSTAEVNRRTANAD